jgi:hypothetical protein
MKFQRIWFEQEMNHCGLRFVNSVWNKEQLPEQWKWSSIAPVYKKCDKTDNTLPNIIFSRLSQYVDKII